MFKKKDKYTILLEEKNCLKLTLDHMILENNHLKHEISDMKNTVRLNKAQLQEYIDNITDKDKVVAKMSNVIEQLKERLSVYEKNKQKYVINLKFK